MRPLSLAKGHPNFHAVSLGLTLSRFVHAAVPWYSNRIYFVKIIAFLASILVTLAAVSHAETTAENSPEKRFTDDTA